jgi:hypothetical protein
MLGLLLGDSLDEWGRELTPGDAPLRSHGTCLIQLACFTLEGLIRAHERSIHKGIVSIEGTIWHAWCRWAHIQALGPQFAERWRFGSGGVGWPDGWLPQVAPLSVRRGSAPATVTALLEQAGVPADEFTAPGNSAGHHALTRVLPLAVLGVELGESAPRVAGTLARFTHGNPAAWEAAAIGVTIAADILAGEREDNVSRATAFADAPPGTAGHALWHGLRAIADSRSLEDAIRSARQHGKGPAVVAGALEAARLGASALDENLLRRHELTWVVDQLARDAIRDVTERPAGNEYTPRSDPTWSSRYPGW